MQSRLAKKIVARVQAGDVARTSYRKDQVEAAFRVMDVPLAPHHLKPWTESSTRTEPEDLSSRQELNRLRQEASHERITQKRNTRDDRRRQAVAVAAGRAAFLQAMREGTHPTDGVIMDHVQSGEGIDREAVKAADPEAFLPDTPTATPETAVSIDLDSLSVTDLKTICREKGLKGYSALKKDDLVALLTAG